MWSLCTKCDPCAQKCDPYAKNVTPMQKMWSLCTKMWSLCTKCDPCAQNVIPMHKNVIPVHKIPNTKKLYQLQSLSLSLQTPAIPPAVQLYTDNSDFATVTQLPISTIVWNRWVKTSRLSTSNSSIVGTIMQRNRIEPELYHNQSTKHNLTLSSSSRGTKPINLLFLLSYKHQAYDTCPCVSQQHIRGTYRIASFEVIAVAQLRVTFCDTILQHWVFPSWYFEERQ